MIPFGPHFVSTGELFFRSALSCGLVNLKPIVPGHVLVISQRRVPRFADLTPEEVNDLFCSAQTIGKIVERVYKATSLTIIIQDGKDAGQTVPHVHVHVIPRRPGDFEPNDIIYDVLENRTNILHTSSHRHRVDNEERKPRSKDEMAQEATWLASFFRG